MPTQLGLSIPPPDVLLDSTLRDGEQAPGVSLSPHEKAEYVRIAERVGVRYLEIGFPQNPFDYAACQAAVAAARHSRLVAMAVTTEDSVAKVSEVRAHEVLLVVPCSESHLRAVYGAPLESLVEQLSRSIRFARVRGLAVNIGLEDAGYGDMQVIGRVIEEAKRHAGDVDCVTIADTRGQLLPAESARLINDIRQMLSGLTCRIAFHAHNDLGLATANSLAALCSVPPVDCVHVTCCGFGERAGNASLEQVAVLLAIKLGRPTRFDLTKLRELALFVQSSFLTPIHPHAPILGAKVFLHESGLHQKGMLNEKTSFQFLDPVAFGVEAELILGKHSGKRLRADIAEEASCAESAVWELQCRLVEEQDNTRDSNFASYIKFLEDYAFKGVRKDRAVGILKQEKQIQT